MKKMWCAAKILFFALPHIIHYYSMLSHEPDVSILIVNFNGSQLLTSCLQSLERLHFPKSQLEVIIVDNNSTDDSVYTLRTHFPWVNVIESERNLGFTGGNNLGYSFARGKYIVLLNSDIRVDPDWLENLVRAAKNKHVGMVNSRLRLSIPFIEVVLDSSVVPRSLIDHSIDHSPVGVILETIRCDDPKYTPLIFYKSGFYDKRGGEIAARRTKGKATVLLPFPLDKKVHEYEFTIHGYEQSEKGYIPVTLSAGGKARETLRLQPFQTTQVKLVLHYEEMQKHLIWLMQNAGNIVMRSGYSKDRGSVVVRTKKELREFYEEDNAYFDKPARLVSACGASVLIKRELIEDIGFLDDHFFMYYEDVDLSLRAARRGWEIMYEPTSIAYHDHSATTGSHVTAFFLSLVERNHLVVVLLHFPFTTFIKECVYFFFRFVKSIFMSFYFQFREGDSTNIWYNWYRARREALIFLYLNFPRLLWQRYKMNVTWPFSFRTIEKDLY